MAEQQAYNEALLKLCILLYQSDGKITLKEQDYFQAVFDNVEWQGEQDAPDFLKRAILEVRDVIERGDQRTFVTSLKDALTYDAKKALAIAQGISHIDGELAEEEQEILDFLQNKVLAKALAA